MAYLATESNNDGLMGLSMPTPPQPPQQAQPAQQAQPPQGAQAAPAPQQPQQAQTPEQKKAAFLNRTPSSDFNGTVEVGSKSVEVKNGVVVVEGQKYFVSHGGEFVANAKGQVIGRIEDKKFVPLNKDMIAEMQDKKLIKVNDGKAED